MAIAIETIPTYDLIADGPLLIAQLDDGNEMPYTMGVATLDDYRVNLGDRIVSLVTFGEFLYHLADAIYHYALSKFGSIPGGLTRPNYYSQAMSYTASRDLQIVRSYIYSFFNRVTATYMYEEALFQQRMYGVYIRHATPQSITSDDIAAEKKRAQEEFDSRKEKSFLPMQFTTVEGEYHSSHSVLKRLNLFFAATIDSEDKSIVEKYRSRAITETNRFLANKTETVGALRIHHINVLIELEDFDHAHKWILQLENGDAKTGLLRSLSTTLIGCGELSRAHRVLADLDFPDSQERDALVEHLIRAYHQKSETIRAKRCLRLISDRQLFNRLQTELFSTT